MTSKSHIPANNLGPFLTSKNIASVDIYAKTGISTAELSQLRNGTIKGIEARKLYLIFLVGKIPMKDLLEGVYPDLKLKTVTNKSTKTDFLDMQDFFRFIEGNIIESLAERTGISIYRLKKIKHNKVNVAAHELYLIELATRTKPGTLFNMLYKGLKLNTPEEEAQLRRLEKEKSGKR